jgi:hypothetical protein
MKLESCVRAFRSDSRLSYPLHHARPFGTRPLEEGRRQIYMRMLSRWLVRSGTTANGGV